MIRYITILFCLFWVFFLTPQDARADLKLCNYTPKSHVGVAFGYKDLKGWVSEGWFNIKTKECKTLLTGSLIARYYYVYAVDYTLGGSWGGDKFMCTADKSFTIRGRTDCVSRGFKKTGFGEVDTKEETDWTVNLFGTAGKIK